MVAGSCFRCLKQLVWLLNLKWTCLLQCFRHPKTHQIPSKDSSLDRGGNGAASNLEHLERWFRCSHLDPAKVEMDSRSIEEWLSCGDWNQIYANFVIGMLGVCSHCFCFSKYKTLQFSLVDIHFKLRIWIDNDIQGPLFFSTFFLHIFSSRWIRRTSDGSVQHGLRLGLPDPGPKHQSHQAGHTTIVPWNTMGVWWDWTI